MLDQPCRLQINSWVVVKIPGQFFYSEVVVATFFHVLFHGVARKACQKLMLEVYVLIVRV